MSHDHSNLRGKGSSKNHTYKDHIMFNNLTIKKSFKLFLLCTSFAVLPAIASAAPEVVPVEGVQYNVSAPLNANLKALTGKTVDLTLASGQQLTGVVSNIGEHLMHLEKLQGKEFFDALIRIDSIVAISTRFREYKH